MRKQKLIFTNAYTEYYIDKINTNLNSNPNRCLHQDTEINIQQCPMPGANFKKKSRFSVVTSLIDGAPGRMVIVTWGR